MVVVIVTDYFLGGDEMTPVLTAGRELSEPG
jgi:hypothetical protein